MDAKLRTPVPVVAGIIRRGDRILICRRPAGGHLPGLWEFPGGKIEPDESPEAALVREVREELGVEVRVGPVFWETVHDYEERTVHLRFYQCQWRGGEAENRKVADHGWVHPKRLKEYDFLPADAPLVETLAGGGPMELPAGRGCAVPAGEREAAYRACLEIAAGHYENFPVASRFLPARIRPHVAAVYAFARSADDFADEPGHAGERLARLDDWGRQLERAVEGRPEGAIFTALSETIRRHGLPVPLFRDLLAAFRQDVEVRRYPDYESLREYCRLSANPVGRIVLLLHGVRDETAFQASDAICTALQLANHLQDVGSDLRRGRIYLPQEDLRTFGVTEADLAGGRITPAFRALMVFEIRRVRALFAKGLALLRRTKGALGRELKAIWRGGVAALESIERAEFDVLSASPRLSAFDKARCLVAAFLPVRALEKRVGGHIDEHADREYCRWIVRRSRSNFSLAFLTLPAERRRALNAIYSFCRTVDDIADLPDDLEAQRTRLDTWKRGVASLSDRDHPHPIVRELAWAAEAYGLPARYLLDVCEGVEMDLEHRRFRTFEDLRLYCHKVASAVGLACLHAFGVTSAEAERYARSLGVALQLTNILRDLWADAKIGRFYLPREDLERFGVSEESFRSGLCGEPLRALLRFEADRARAFYREAEEVLPPGSERALMPARLMGRIYRAMLEEMEAAGFPVWTRRPVLSKARKLREAVLCLLGR